MTCTDLGAYLLLSADLAALTYVGIAQIGDIGLTDPEFSLKVSLVMRPCDGTSGLVRGNRRKAVFAFKGLFIEGHLSVFASGRRVLPRISEVRGKSKLAAHSDFCQQNRRSQESKTGVWSADLIFSPHFLIRLSIICANPWNPRAQRLFRIKDPQVEALWHFGALGTPGICRILLSFRPCILCSRCCKHLIDAI